MKRPLLSLAFAACVIGLFGAERAGADDTDAFQEFDKAFEDAAPEESAPGSTAPAAAAASPATHAAPAAPADDSLWSKLRFEGSLKNETAHLIHGDTHLSKIRNQAIFVQGVALSDDIQLKASQRGYYDAVYDLTDNYPENVRDDQDHLLEFRDTYIDYSAGDFDIRLGKQQIVWGEAIGLFFADTVNAKDFREFVLPDFDMIRIPEWGADIDYSQGDFHLEVVYIPLPEMNEVGVENSDYEFSLPVPEGVPFRRVGGEEPENTAENSQYGGRVSYLTGGWDIGAFYLYTWDKNPIYFRSFDPDGTVVITPDFRRQHIIGATFSKDVDPVVLKGELVVNPNGSFSTSDPSDADGVTRKTFIDYVLGMNYNLFDWADTNVQLIQRAIFDHEDTLIDNEDAVRNYVSFWAGKNFFDDALETQFLIMAGLNDVDMMIRPSARYKLTGNLDWKLGVDFFEGKSSGLFGQFEDGSRAYSEITYRF